MKKKQTKPKNPNTQTQSIQQWLPEGDVEEGERDKMNQLYCDGWEVNFGGEHAIMYTKDKI